MLPSSESEFRTPMLSSLTLTWRNELFYYFCGEDFYSVFQQNLALSLVYHLLNLLKKLIGKSYDCCRIVFLNSASYHCTIAVILCLTSKARCVEERRSEKTFKSERANEIRKMRIRARFQWKRYTIQNLSRSIVLENSTSWKWKTSIFWRIISKWQEVIIWGVRSDRSCTWRNDRRSIQWSGEPSASTSVARLFCQVVPQNQISLFEFAGTSIEISDDAILCIVVPTQSTTHRFYVRLNPERANPTSQEVRCIVWLALMERNRIWISQVGGMLVAKQE